MSNIWFYGSRKYPKVIHDILCYFGLHSGYFGIYEDKFGTVTHRNCRYCDYEDYRNKKGQKTYPDGEVLK